MTEKQFKNLSRGDIIKHIMNEERYIVSANYGGRVTAVSTVDLINPFEWNIVLKATLNPPAEED